MSAAVDVNLGFSFCESGLGLRAARWAGRVIRPQSSRTDQRRMAIEAARAGYSALYTPDWRGADAFGSCGSRWEATERVRPGGITVGTMVSPIPKYPDAADLARMALALSRTTRGRFVLGVGAGDLDRRAVRAELGCGDDSLDELVRWYLRRLIALLDAPFADIGEGARPRLLLGAMGPRMLRVAGELADGVVLSFATAKHVGWVRERVAEGAERSGRDPSSIDLLQSVPVCVSDDLEMARRRLRVAVLPYLRGPEIPERGAPRRGYRRQIERLGFGPMLDEIDELSRHGATADDLLARISDSVLSHLGYAGPADGAAAAVARICHGLDEVTVRITAVTERYRSVSDALRALGPGRRWETSAPPARSSIGAGVGSEATPPL